MSLNQIVDFSGAHAAQGNEKMIGTIFDQVNYEETQAVLHPYGKEVAALSELRSEKISDHLALAKACFQSGNEEFGFYYLEKHIQKNKEVLKFPLLVTAELFDEDEEEKDTNLFVCWEAFESEDPIVLSMLDRKGHLDPNLHFRDAKGNVIESYNTCRGFAEKILRQTASSPELLPLFMKFLMCFKFEIGLHFMFVPRSQRASEEEVLTLEQAKILMEVCRFKAEHVSKICANIPRASDLLGAVQYSKTDFKEMAFHCMPFSEYALLDKSLLPFLTDWVLHQDASDLSDELIAALVQHKECFREFFEDFAAKYGTRHSSSGTKLYHGLGFPTAEVKYRFSFCRCECDCSCRARLQDVICDYYVQVEEFLRSGDCRVFLERKIAAGKFVFEFDLQAYEESEYSNVGLALETFPELASKIPEKYWPKVSLKGDTSHLSEKIKGVVERFLSCCTLI